MIISRLTLIKSKQVKRIKKDNKWLSEDDKKEGLFKKLKNIENAQRNLIKDDDNESIYYTPRS